ncbi:MAG: hypothetical protein H6635_09025 [Anaerolineales bacterium]|nr:hypothetical protein [Anaerolineales bacterium]MCB9145499.1 hypothetical protein [Anaerolineales bacterium]
MKPFLQNIILQTALALLIGFGLGLAYSWLISPVTYVDATPALLRTDFKDQYRIVIAASYSANQDMARARARLSLLGDTDPVGELSAQAQRMLANGEPFEKARPLAQLATDLQRGYVSEPFTPTPFPTFSTPQAQTSATAAADQPQVNEEATITPIPTVFFEQTPLSTPVTGETSTPRPTFTPTAGPGVPFILTSQDTLCQPAYSRLMQFMFMDARRVQKPGIEINVTWDQGEDKFFTGFKPDLGNGYADFMMEAGTVYNIRIVTGGAFVADITAPTCTDETGAEYPGGLLLTFQQP